MGLKVCPMCGYNDPIWHKYRKLYGYFVECTSCGLSTGVYPSLEAAWQAWNRRYDGSGAENTEK